MVGVETEIEDYTTMTEGEEVEGGVIATCPRCGRMGRLSHKNGHSVYEHRRTGPEETHEICVI